MSQEKDKFKIRRNNNSSLGKSLAAWLFFLAAEPEIIAGLNAKQS
jgi:hypothetical protein